MHLRLAQIDGEVSIRCVRLVSLRECGCSRVLKVEHLYIEFRSRFEIALREKIEIAKVDEPWVVEVDCALLDEIPCRLSEVRHQVRRESILDDSLGRRTILVVIRTKVLRHGLVAEAHFINSWLDYCGICAWCASVWHQAIFSVGLRGQRTLVDDHHQITASVKDKRVIVDLNAVHVWANPGRITELCREKSVCLEKISIYIFAPFGIHEFEGKVVFASAVCRVELDTCNWFRIDIALQDI